MSKKDALYIIPARGGSKGVPAKNIKPLVGKPLLLYTIEEARKLADDDDICLTTDDESIKACAEGVGLKVPFLRPSELSRDSSSMYEVLLHALSFYRQKGRVYEILVLLQPTSPFRKYNHIQEAMKLWEEGLEMVVSVKETKSNPYYVLFEENEKGFLEPSKKGTFTNRQQCPKVYEYNGAVYIIDVKSLLQTSLSDFTRVRKYLMDEESSLDIDTLLDWKYAEFLFSLRGGDEQ